MPAVDIVVTDLDGTLSDGRTTIHPAGVEAIGELRRQGVDVILATGRRRRAAEHLLGTVGLSMPAVLLGGSVGVDLDTGLEFHRAAFEHDDAVRVIESFESMGIDPVVYVEAGDIETYAGHNCATHPEHLQNLGSWVRRDAARAVLDLHPVLSFAVIGYPDERVREIAAELADSAECFVHPDLSYGGWSIMVGPRDVTKWNGITAYCEQQGHDPSRLLAIGDGGNDVDMLEKASISIAMADGQPEALAAAQHVAPPSTDGGWAYVLEHAL